MQTRGPIGVKFGQHVKSPRIEKMDFKEDQVYVVSLPLPDDIKAVYTHFDDSEGGLKMFYCQEGLCCEALSMPSLYYVAPVLQYSVFSETEYGMPVALRYWRFKEEMYKVLEKRLKNAGVASIADLDFEITCKDAKYQDLDVDIRNREARWKSDPMIQQFLREETGLYRSRIEQSIARLVSREDVDKHFAQMLGRAMTTVPTMPPAPPVHNAVQTGNPPVQQSLPTAPVTPPVPSGEPLAPGTQPLNLDAFLN